MKQTPTQKNWNEHFGTNEKKGKSRLPAILVVMLIVGCMCIAWEKYTGESILARLLTGSGAAGKSGATNSFTTVSTGMAMTPGASVNSDKNGIKFRDAMQALLDLEKKIQYAESKETLNSLKDQVEAVKVHSYYEPIKSAVLEFCNYRIKNIADRDNQVIKRENEYLVEIYDVMCECFDKAGIRYDRKSDLEIQFWYYEK